MSLDRLAAFASRLRPLLDANALLEDDAVNPASARDAAPVAGERPRLLLRPRDAADVSAILAAATETGQPIVVQGGRTGLAGGARPKPGEAALSLERMRGISPVDPIAATVEIGAGVPLEEVQRSARAAGMYFGVDLGARGTATVGGMIATNAGGIRVLRYGMFREQVAGIEAVLADGTVVDAMRGLPKDNAGYDLRHLFVGSEGTLGIVTRAKLRLRPAPATESAALLSLASLGQAIALLALLRGRLGDLLAAFEIIFPDVYAGTVSHVGIVPPLAPGAGLYVLTDIQGQMPEADVPRFHAVLAEAMEEGLVQDTVLSSSGREFDALWALREGVSDYVFAQGEAHGHDIGVPLGAMEGFLTAAAQRIAAIDAGARIFVFGHLGDGNLHYIVQSHAGAAVTDAVFGTVAEAGGTISAEHGIGADKLHWLSLCRSVAERSVMARLKQALDPAGILNRDRVVPTPPASQRGENAAQ